MATYEKETMVNAGFTAPQLTLDKLDAVGVHLDATSRSAALRLVIDMAHDTIPKRKQVKK